MSDSILMSDRTAMSDSSLMERNLRIWRQLHDGAQDIYLCSSCRLHRHLFWFENRGQETPSTARDQCHFFMLLLRAKTTDVLQAVGETVAFLFCTTEEAAFRITR